MFEGLLHNYGALLAQSQAEGGRVVAVQRWHRSTKYTFYRIEGSRRRIGCFCSTTAFNIQRNTADGSFIELRDIQNRCAFGNARQAREDPPLQFRIEAKANLEHEKAAAFGTTRNSRGLVFDHCERRVLIGPFSFQCDWTW